MKNGFGPEDTFPAAPPIRYYERRRVSKKATITLPPEARRYGAEASVTVFADGTAVVGRPYLIPDIPYLRWRDYRDVCVPDVTYRPGFEPDPEETKAEADDGTDENGQYRMFDERDLPQTEIRRGRFAKETEHEKEKENHMRTNAIEQKDLAEMLRTMTDSLRGAMNAVQSCIDTMNGFMERLHA